MTDKDITFATMSTITSHLLSMIIKRRFYNNLSKHYQHTYHNTHFLTSPSCTPLFCSPSAGTSRVITSARSRGPSANSNNAGAVGKRVRPVSD